MSCPGKFKNLKQTVGWPYQFYCFFSGDIKKKKKKKKSSENDKLTGHFQSFFIYFFLPPHPLPHPPTLNLKNNSRKSTNKKNSGLNGQSSVFSGASSTSITYICKAADKALTGLHSSTRAMHLYTCVFTCQCDCC